MLHIEIETIWRFHKEGSPQTVVVVLGILNEIRKTGKITSAARDARLSYRHVWNLIEKWSDFFGVPLVETHRGKGSQPDGVRRETCLGRPTPSSPAWPAVPEPRTRTGNGNQSASSPRSSVIRVHASHGFAVSKLREMLDREPGLGVDLRYVSNQNSLVSLAHDGCDLSGMHLPQGELRKRSIDACKGWLKPAFIA